MLKRSTCETDGSPDIEVLTQDECCGTGEASECGVCSTESGGNVKHPMTGTFTSVSSIMTKPLCEAIACAPRRHRGGSLVSPDAAQSYL